MTSKQQTITSLVTRAFVKALVGTCALAAVTVTADAATPHERAERPHAEGSPAALVEQYGCWTDIAPADMQGKVPGHVVIRYEGESTARYRGAKAVDIALNHLFTKPDPRVATIVGFCR